MGWLGAGFLHGVASYDAFSAGVSPAQLWQEASFWDDQSGTRPAAM